VGDISQTGTVERLLNETVSAFGRPRHPINNAGDLIRRYPLRKRLTTFFDAQIATNVAGVRRLP
jgi:NAD(P)-dependent dehydrogenase (short-subunit alcohol dehydrogenase family)